MILRGIAWAGKRSNVDVLLRPDELGDALRYVEGGPTHPDKAAATIEVHPEFDLSLVAAEPLIQKAMNLDWDERGRLWVSETPEYPNGRRRAERRAVEGQRIAAAGETTRDPEDTISILSDTNGDGRMDRKHVFADKLELVTGFVLHRSGVIAATAPDIWYLEDTNGDEVADRAHEALHRPRHGRHALGDQQPALGSRRLDLRDARLQHRRRSRRRTARRTSAATAAASCASSRMAARSSSTAAAAATRGASTSPGTVRCSGRSRRAAPCSSTPCCRRACWRRAACRTRRPRRA